MKKHNWRLMLRRVLNLVFSRLVVTAVLLVLQMVWLFALFYRLADYARWFNAAGLTLSIIMCLALIRQDSTVPEFKISWMILFAVMPVQGGLLYLLWGNKRPALGLRRRQERAEQAMTDTRREDPAAVARLRAADPRAALTARYLHDYAPAPLYGGTAEIAMSYTESPVHNEDYFVKLAVDIQKMGADVICIKDMANLLLPYKAYSLVKRLKKETDLPIVLHTHNTTGTGDMVLLKAIEAGVDVVDTCLSPLGSGTSQPATESLVATLKGTEYDTGFDLDLLAQLAAHFRTVADRLTKDGWRDPARVLGVDVKTLQYQVPGGMLSNLIGQLKQANQMDKYYDVLAEVPRVRKDFGYPPLVTPTSQIVGTQAVMNVLGGERYKMVPKESKDLLAGHYGRLPGKVNEDVRKKCIGDTKVITHRYADDIPPELDKLREEMREWYQCEEDVLSYAMFPKVAPKFFEYRAAQQLKVDSTMLNKADKTMPV